MRHFPRLLILTLLLAPLGLAADVAKRHYKLGQDAEKRGASLEAYSRYVQARAANPSSRKYLRAAIRLRAATAQAIAIQSTSGLLEVESEEHAPPLETTEFFNQASSLKEALGATELEVKQTVASFRLDGTVQEAYERVFKEFGIDVLFDEGFGGSEQTRFHLDDVDFEDAVLALNEIATAFVVPLTAKLVLVAEDTPGKRTELEPVVSIDVPIPEAATPQDATEVAQAVQQTLDIRRLFVVPSRNIVTIRDSPAKARMARLLLERLLMPRAEVVLEVDIIAYNHNRDTDLGVTLPSVFEVTNYSTVLNAVPPEPGGAPEIIVGGGRTVFGIGVADASFVARLMVGAGSSTQRLSVRALDRTEAQIRFGERFPIITASFEPGSGIDPGGDRALFQLPAPTVTFEDLGLSVNVTPTVHEAGEVTLHLLVEFNLLSGEGVNEIPIIVNRTLETQIRLRAGESAIVAGMAIEEQRRISRTSLGLVGIPVVSNLLTRKTNQTKNTDLLVLVRPRIVRPPAADMVKELSIRFGPEERPLSAL